MIEICDVTLSRFQDFFGGPNVTDLKRDSAIFRTIKVAISHDPNPHPIQPLSVVQYKDVGPKGFQIVNGCHLKFNEVLNYMFDFS